MNPSDLQKESLRERQPPNAPMISSNKLFEGAREIQIEHRGQVYRLRRTRSEKLILHK